MENLMRTILEHNADLSSGKTTSRKIVEAALAKIDDKNGEGVRTFIKVYREAALTEADASDRLRRQGIVPSPLAGLPISLKDLFDVAGDVTLAGIKAHADFPAAQSDAPVVRRLRAAGAVIIGRTNLSPMAFSPLGVNRDFGTPGNPADRLRIPGGSSSGAAVSVTDAMAVAAIGSDTGGSIRMPAAFCGVAGIKPTQKRVPLTQTWPLSTSLDSVGPLAPSIACCALVDAAITGDEIVVPAAISLRGLRFALPMNSVTDDMDATVAKAFQRALEILSKHGAQIIETALPEIGEVIAMWRTPPSFTQMEGYARYGKWLTDNPDAYDPFIRARFAVGANASAKDYIDLIHARTSIIERSAKSTRNFDAVIMPTVQFVAPTIAEASTEEGFKRIVPLAIRNPSIANMLDRCAISTPCHQAGELPVGLSLMGEHGEDRRLLAMGLSVEAALKI
jgi:aspartyl-tRNA(Asn)/glutamyl-tRNA(Gln) amidotransferase subunit A